MTIDDLNYIPGRTLGHSSYAPDAIPEGFDEATARRELETTSAEIAKYQDMLMAHEQYGLIVLFQGMDGAGKDSAIKETMKNLDPQGCEVKMFKKSVGKELKHGSLWRAARSAPARGQIGIFNRSYYETVIGERVHPERIEEYGLPKELTSPDMWDSRLKHINNFEEYLMDNGIHVLKIFLNISKETQREKLLERIKRSDKKWKFAADDVEDRKFWKKYMKAYEEAFEKTSTPDARWYIVPDNDRWFARAAIASIILKKLRSFHSRYPTLDKEKKAELDSAKKKLESGK